MLEKDEMAVPQTFPPKIKDSGKFTISYNIGELKMPHALCDSGSSINALPLNKMKELKVGEIILSNMNLTLDDSSVTHPLGILRYMLVHIDGLVFPEDFVVLDTKGDSRGLTILGFPFLATGKALIDVENGELVLNFNKEKMVFNMYD
ncbi:uncharacterized protein LOC127138139 [Lathyrus oleraceus]|uniref:uncharacterized protein LOC127138139 n=1 Tax=Pisum sativum TaxID=3888 RepID=UPI0021CE69C3|nr:uncharacterized protein LOC127138139 [Pisum sativum]